MNNTRPIGVFDSGIGGLTVVQALMKHLPNENLVYFGDTARVPYGPKSAQVVREYAVQDTDELLKHDVKFIIIACNTVSAVALDVVQKRAKVPVLGVILPGAEAAVRATKTNRLGVIGTFGTVFSNAYTNAIRQINPVIQVFSKACPLFVPLAEEGWTSHPATELVAKEYLFPLTLEKIDTLILGCTHYPLLKDVIDSVLHKSVILIDSGEATALTAVHLLEERKLRNESTLKPNVQFFVSDIPHKFSEVGERFLGQRLGKIQRVAGFSA
jgi:glutamate racemase